MKQILLTLLFIFSAQNSYACPELNDVDLANGDGPWMHEEIDFYDIQLTKEEFVKIPNFDFFEYEKCKNALYVKVVRSKKTGRVFNAVMTNEDHCDGGNSYGALFNSDMKTFLGDIRDSYISCHLPTRKIDLF
ncbi:MAG: hypothetical protein HN576_09850 [Bacteriovoracaceae bacterium]|nr:hypothetical protein [Bacteriovoracaceae bacterium]